MPAFHTLCLKLYTQKINLKRAGKVNSHPDSYVHECVNYRELSCPGSLEIFLLSSSLIASDVLKVKVETEMSSVGCEECSRTT